MKDFKGHRRSMRDCLRPPRRSSTTRSPATAPCGPGRGTRHAGRGRGCSATLDEEEATDHTLTELATSVINLESGGRIPRRGLTRCAVDDRNAAASRGVLFLDCTTRIARRGAHWIFGNRPHMQAFPPLSLPHATQKSPRLDAVRSPGFADPRRPAAPAVRPPGSLLGAADRRAGNRARAPDPGGAPGRQSGQCRDGHS